MYKKKIGMGRGKVKKKGWVYKWIKEKLDE